MIEPAERILPSDPIARREAVSSWLADVLADPSRYNSPEFDHVVREMNGTIAGIHHLNGGADGWVPPAYRSKPSDEAAQPLL